MTALTALEIFSHPYDISIGVGQAKKGEKFAFAICRGREHEYKPLLSTIPYFESLEDALKKIQEILTTAIMYSLGELRNVESYASQVINPEGLDVAQLEVLNTELVQVILDQLRESRPVDTFDLKPVLVG